MLKYTGNNNTLGSSSVETGFELTISDAHTEFAASRIVLDRRMNLRKLSS